MSDQDQCSAMTRRKTRCQHRRFSSTFAYLHLGLDGQLPEAKSRCALHLSAEGKLAARRARDEREGRWERNVDTPPACWSWAVTAEIQALIDEYHNEDIDLVDRIRARRRALDSFAGDRCGICNRPGAYVEDHDHRTGLVRGMLCRGCNRQEGAYPADGNHVWSYYRERNPYSMLGLKEPYTGYGWENGVPIRGWPKQRDAVDEWENNVLDGVGL